MIFQEFVREVCDGKPAEAARVIEDATGQPIGYARAHRWYRNPSPISVQFARLIVQGTGGRCTLEELVDPEVIASRFKFEDDPAAERRHLEQRLAQRERELKQLQALQRLGRTIDTTTREVKQLRARLAKLGETAPRRRGRPVEQQPETDTPPRKRRRKNAAPAAAA